MKPEAHRTALCALILIEAATFTIAGPAASETALISVTNNGVNRNFDSESIDYRGEGRGMSDDHDLMEKPKSKPWLGYYDFLITEGSYKFWVVFELFTVALLVYSAFAAIYYAKYTVTDYDDYDYFFKKRSARSLPQQSPQFLGLSTETYLRIFEAIADLKRQYS